MDAVGPLADTDVTGRLAPHIETVLRAEPETLRTVARSLVDSQFPPSLAADVLAAAGLDPGVVLGSAPVTALSSRRSRSAGWVAQVLQAWDRQCAFCGFDGQLGASLIGIEAAHVRWFNLGGPDEPDNGLALCSLHHKLFDRGALGLSHDHTIKVSAAYAARTDAGRAVYDLHRRSLQPRPGTALPSARHLDWHDREVFKGNELAA